MKQISFLILILTSVLFLTVNQSQGQINNPVKWTYQVKKTSDNTADIVITAGIGSDWALYSQYVPEGGPLPTVLKFNVNKSYRKTGKTAESPKPKIKYDDVFDMNIGIWHKEAFFTTPIEIIDFKKFNFTVDIDYMACSKESCIPLNESLSISVDGTQYSKPKEIKTDTVSTENLVKTDSVTPDTTVANKSDSQITNAEPSKKSPWYVFWMGLVGGLLALMTPCVWPIIPMTVSFFLNKTQSKKGAVRDATIYGISIIFVYVLLGLGVSLIFGAEKLNQLATSPWFNIFFFALLVVFAIAFFGAFELTLPSKWVNAMDRKSEKSSGLLGVFFMALTLVLVSFSCTGPIVGALLVEAASTANFVSPLLGMLGFSISIAVPFTLLAIFPSWLKSMPKSGGWMNSIKVVLAFMMLAFSLKFFTVADMVAGWNLMPREVFLSIWIVLFVLNGFYLLGKIKMYHDSDVKHITIGRMFFAIVSFSFAVWMLPGMWGAPLKAISSFAPPMTTQSFDLGKRTSVASQQADMSQFNGYKVKEGAYGLIMFLNYDEGMKFATEKKKPVFLEFSGIGCSNCKKMEASVLGEPEVLPHLMNDYVVISLYTDDRTELPENEQFISTVGGKEKKITTVGRKWGDLQAAKYGVNAQPYYVLLDNTGNKLADPRAFNTNVDEFSQFLKTGITEYKKRNQ